MKEPNFCENCAMDLLTCDCVVKRPVHLETATDPDCAAPRVWEGDKPHGANYAGWRREVIAAQPAADNAPQAPSAGSVPDYMTFYNLLRKEGRVGKDFASEMAEELVALFQSDRENK